MVREAASSHHAASTLEDESQLVRIHLHGRQPKILSEEHEVIKAHELGLLRVVKVDEPTHSKSSSTPTQRGNEPDEVVVLVGYVHNLRVLDPPKVISLTTEIAPIERHDVMLEHVSNSVRCLHAVELSCTDQHQRLIKLFSGHPRAVVRLCFFQDTHCVVE